MDPRERLSILEDLGSAAADVLEMLESGPSDEPPGAVATVEAPCALRRLEG